MLTKNPQTLEPVLRPTLQPFETGITIPRGLERLISVFIA